MNKSDIDNKIIKKISSLAKLDLNDSEIETLAPEISQIIDYISQLESVDTTNVNPLFQVNNIKNVTRHDITSPSITKKSSLTASSKTHNSFFITNATLSHD